MSTTTKMSTAYGYQSIGSFHSENVEDLMSRSDDEYVPPSLPFDSQESLVRSTGNTTDHSNTQNPSHHPLFMMDRTNWTFLNHGAFGGALQCGYDRAHQWRAYLEEQPLRFFDRDLLPHLVYSARRMATFCNAQDNKQGMALAQNVTSLLNAAISGYVQHYQQRAKIVIWDTSYGTVKKMAHAYCNTVIEIPFQSNYLSHLTEVDGTDDIFLQALDDTLMSSSIDPTTTWHNTLLILDHTTSNTAINVPIELLSKRAKELGMIVLVDGAHGLLAQDVNVTKLTNVDMYVSNGHKWLSCPRGVAMMYCPHAWIRDTILKRPAVVSHGIDDGYLSRFLWDGCRDYAAQLALPVVLDVWEKAHPPLVRSWIHSQLTTAVSILAESWHGCGDDMESWPGHVTLGPMSVHSPMVLVKLPSRLCGKGVTATMMEAPPKTSADAKQIQDFLFDHHIEVPIKCINGILYVRLSCHIYNELKEYDRLGQVMLTYPPS